MTTTEETICEVFQIHLPYEIDRLIGIYELLLDGKRYKTVADPKGHLDDALIVGFCTHARNLLEFFFRKENTKWNYAIALDYATKPYLPLEKRDDVDRLYKQLCAQINHLTYERTDKMSKKIGPKERKELIDLIHKEACRLSKSLASTYDTGCLRIDQLAKAAAMEITVDGTVTSSSYSFPISSLVGVSSLVGGTTTIQEALTSAHEKGDRK